MDSIDQLLHLRQGGLSIEEYVHQFCELSFQVPLYDEFLFKDLFHFGLNKHIKSLFHESLFPGGEFNGSLRGLMDCALLYAGSSFTVGVAEEERDTASLTKMADAPECTYKMAEATTHHQFPESHNMPAEPESAHVLPAKPGSAHVVPAKPGSALVVPAKPGSVLVMPAKPGPARVMSAMPESPAKMATTPADAPLWPGLIACVLDAPLVSVRAAGITRAAALTVPESPHVSADRPESPHVSADRPESPHVTSSRARSVPGVCRVRSRTRSVPGVCRVRSRARSVPGVRRGRSRARSIPGVRRVRSRVRSVPGARRIRLPRAPAGSVWLRRAPAGSFQFSISRAPPRLSTSRMPPDVRASRVPP